MRRGKVTQKSKDEANEIWVPPWWNNNFCATCGRVMIYHTVEGMPDVCVACSVQAKALINNARIFGGDGKDSTNWTVCVMESDININPATRAWAERFDALGLIMIVREPKDTGGGVSA